jgi:salicylate hydroxylase
VASSRNVIVAGAGIGGLTAALALAQGGFRVSLIEQTETLEETGAGIQVSPNATRILLALGLGDRLRADCVAPDAIEVHSASGRRLVTIPLGASAEKRYGAPYWVTHRADLQAALLEAVRAHPDITLSLGTRVEDFVLHGNGVSVACRRGAETADQQGIALVAADGLWSGLRTRLGYDVQPRFRRRTAWRALLPAEHVASEFRSPRVHLWLGRNAHLVHYPVRGGALINIVAIVRDRMAKPGWSEAGSRAELIAHFARAPWADAACALIARPASWHKWALHDLPPLPDATEGPVMLIGDAAHPMLPFLAQGAAMAIEDAAVLADHLAAAPDDPAATMRRAARARRRRTARVQRAARRNSTRYHLGGPAAWARDIYLAAVGGNMLLRSYDWLYDWRAIPPRS